jgi:hypothetical protein
VLGRPGNALSTNLNSRTLTRSLWGQHRPGFASEAPKRSEQPNRSHVVPFRPHIPVYSLASFRLLPLTSCVQSGSVFGCLTSYQDT